MANHNLPQTTSTYVNFVSEIDARFDDLAVGLDPAATTATNVPTNSVRWNSALKYWEKYNGSTWAALSPNYSININGTIGATTPSTGAFTTLSTSSTTALAAGTTVGGNAVVTVSDTQTLTNKTLTSPTISTITNSGSLTLPTSTDTLVGRATTDTLTNKTLTTPRFADLGFIADVNGNELLVFDSTASAANEITLSNAAASGTPSLAATGSDTNISFNLISKGTGTVQVNGANAVTVSTSQTLTNKTLTTPVLSATASGATGGALGFLSGVFSYGDGSAQRSVVNTDSSQTLTNKTLSSGSTWSANTIATSYGGTGTTSAPSQGGIIYGNSTSAYASTAVGTSGQVLRSNGASAPTWMSQSSIAAGTADNIENTTPSLGYSLSGQDIGYVGQGGPQVRSQGGGAAMMSFHRPGAYAINFGLGADNQLRTGGWSRGGSYVVLDSGNYNSYAPTLTGTGASGTWGISVTGNAATAYGLNVHTDRNNEANKVVRTDGNGYIQAGWINTTSGDNGTTAIDRVYASMDGYIRYYTPTNFRTVLDVPTRGGSGASGTWGINISGNAATATNATSSSFATTAFNVSGGTASVTSMNDGQLAGMRNRIINGSMTIAQRGTSFAGISTGQYTVDRWTAGISGGGAATASQQSDVPSNNQFQNSLRFAVTTADTSIASPDYGGLAQSIEGYNVRDLIGKTFTISFWVRSAKTGTHCLSLRNNGPDRSYVAEYSIGVANTWEYKSITIPNGLITAGSWDWTNGIGMRAFWTIAAGSSWHTTANAWQIGNFISTANQVNALDSIGNIFAITGVQVEVGSLATPFEQRPYGAELLLCQRYYEVLNSLSDSGGSVLVYGNSTWATWQYKVTKRARPTIAGIYTGPLASAGPEAARVDGSAGLFAAFGFNGSAYGPATATAEL